MVIALIVIVVTFVALIVGMVVLKGMIEFNYNYFSDTLDNIIGRWLLRCWPHL